MTAQEQSQPNKKLTIRRLTVVQIYRDKFSVVTFSPICCSGLWEDPYRVFFPACPSTSGSHFSIWEISTKWVHAVLEQPGTWFGHTDQSCSQRAGCLAHPRHIGLIAHPLHSYSTQAPWPFLQGLGHLRDSCEFRVDAYLFFSDSTTFLCGKRYIWTCKSRDFGWDAAHTEAMADFNCYVSDENEEILFKTSVSLKKSDLYFRIWPH